MADQLEFKCRSISGSNVVSGFRTTTEEFPINIVFNGTTIDHCCWQEVVGTLAFIFDDREFSAGFELTYGTEPCIPRWVQNFLFQRSRGYKVQATMENDDDDDDASPSVPIPDGSRLASADCVVDPFGDDDYKPP